MRNDARAIVVAVAGNPNSGKSTLINAIAGTRLHVGNWAGVTVEKKEAKFDYRGRSVRLVDLPGTYSLSPYTQEEIIARDYLVSERPDLIVNVVDATNLERNLYLTMQLLELGIPVVMALNVYDEAEAKGYSIDVKGLETMLGITVVPTSAVKKIGIGELLDAVVAVADCPDDHEPNQLNYGEDVEQALELLEKELAGERGVLENYPKRWLLLNLLEGDSHVRDVVRIDVDAERALHHLKKRTVTTSSR